MTLLTIEHKQQQRESDCLVACTQMVLSYLGVEITSGRLSRLLDITESYGLLNNLRFLTDLGMNVHYDDYGDIAIFEQHLAIGLPIIAGVQTLGWKHWHQEVTYHAVVVVGLNLTDRTIAIHDPFLPEGPIEMPILDFEIGWFEKDAQYVVIGLTGIE